MSTVTQTPPKPKPAPVPELFLTLSGLRLANAIVYAVRGGEHSWK